MKLDFRLRVNSLVLDIVTDSPFNINSPFTLATQKSLSYTEVFPTTFVVTA